MFRRIELIFPRGKTTYPDGTVQNWPEEKRGLLTGWGAMADTWFGKLRGPDRPIPRNAKFYFTEHGWREIGRKVAAACKKERQQFRIIRVKERDVEVVWRDLYYDTEVAAQPRKKNPRRRKGDGTS
jgi:hypothetical protein